MILSRLRKRDGATVYSIRYLGPGSRRKKLLEKVGAVKAGAKEAVHRQMRARAATVLEERRIEIDNGTWIPPDERRPGAVLTFEQLVGEFLAGYESRSGSMAYYKERAAVWLQHFKKRKAVDRITVGDVDRFCVARKRKAGPSTLRKDLVALSTMFRWGQVRGMVKHNPADPALVRRPSEPRHRRGYLTNAQVEALLAECDTWLRPIVEWCLETGMDRQEVLTLTWRDIDEEAGIIEAPRAKTGIERAIPLTKALRALLRHARRVRTLEAHQRIFLRDGKPVHLEAAKSALRRAYGDAGIQVPGPWKILRHTLGSRLAMRNVTAATIARLLGHTTQEVTDRYMHLSPEYLREAREGGEKSPDGDVKAEDAS